MLKSRSIYRLVILCGAVVATSPAGNAVAAAADADAALCKPPYSVASATEIYDAAEKLAKPDMSSLGAAIYKIPQQIGRDGFESDEVFFANSAVGVLIKGERADDLAKAYGLKPETSDLMGASSKGYALELPAEQQPPEGLAGPGKVSIVAREGSALQGKTLLACEFIPDGF